jgi:predicted transcriptional regulator
MTLETLLAEQREVQDAKDYVRANCDHLFRMRKEVCTQEQMARVCGVSRMYIHLLESGRTNRIGKAALLRIVVQYKKLEEYRNGRNQGTA